MCRILLIFFLPLLLFGEDSILLKNLNKAEVGDFVVIAQGKSYTLFHIFDVQKPLLTIEEITIPASLACRQVKSWRSWVEKNAPQNTSWVHYQIDLQRGEIKNYYSFTKNGRFLVPEAENFLATLLRLQLQPMDSQSRRKVGQKKGGQDTRKFWQPNMVVNGQVQPNVEFDAYIADWPHDGGPLSGKSIEIYLPHNEGAYPDYFPYWLQTSGMMGQAKVRVVDSGKGLNSPKKFH